MMARRFPWAGRDARLDDGEEGAAGDGVAPDWWHGRVPHMVPTATAFRPMRRQAMDFGGASGTLQDAA